MKVETKYFSHYVPEKGWVDEKHIFVHFKKGWKDAERIEDKKTPVWSDREMSDIPSTAADARSKFIVATEGNLEYYMNTAADLERVLVKAKESLETGKVV